jgi:WD40 repeat protein
MPIPIISSDNCTALQSLYDIELGWTTHLAWSPRIAQLAASSAQGIFLYTFSAQGIVRSQLPGDDELWRSVTYAPDGFWVVGGADEGRIQRWRVEPQQPRDVVQHTVTADVGAVHVLWDHTLLLTAGPHILCFPPNADATSTPTPLTTGDDDKTAIASSTAGPQHLVAATGWDGHIYVWRGDIVAMPERWKRHTDRVNALAFSPNAQWLASVGRDGAIVLWDVAAGTVKVQRNGHAPYPVDSVGFSPDGRLLATGGRDHVCRLWDAETLSPLAALEAHTKPVIALAWRPDGRMVATGSGDHHIRLWSVGHDRL